MIRFALRKRFRAVPAASAEGDDLPGSLFFKFLCEVLSELCRVRVNSQAIP